MSEQSAPSKNSLDRIEEAVEDIRAGRVVIVVDDENRENEGDFIAAAETITPETVNFMATHGRGLICAPLTEGRCRELGLQKMVDHNTDPLETAFTVSVDLRGNGVTTGISALDRTKTIQALIDPLTKPHELARPGHIFPLIAKEGGVLRRSGHTEAAIDLARLAGLEPAGVIVEIMNEDGSMARLPDLYKVAERFDLKIVSIEDLIAYRIQHDSLIELKTSFSIDTRFGPFQLHAFQQTTNDQVHVALTKGNWKPYEPVPVRINSHQVNNDILGNLTDHPDQALQRMFDKVNEIGKGVIVFIDQGSAPFDLLARLNAYKKLQEEGIKKAPRVGMDNKDYGIGAQILHSLGVKNIRLISNSQQLRRVGISGFGLEIVEIVHY